MTLITPIYPAHTLVSQAEVRLVADELQMRPLKQSRPFSSA
jgi:hypothetical protein